MIVKRNVTQQALSLIRQNMTFYRYHKKVMVLYSFVITFSGSWEENTAKNKCIQYVRVQDLSTKSDISLSAIKRNGFVPLAKAFGL